MIAAIGGANSITILPFDEAYRLPDEFSYRLSRNIQLILKEESMLNKVSDPSAGSYYIEQITQKMVDASWKLFLEIEKNGGFIASLKGSVQLDEESTNFAIFLALGEKIIAKRSLVLLKKACKNDTSVND